MSKQLLDHEKKINEYKKTMDQVIEQNRESPLWSDKELNKMKDTLENLKEDTYKKLSAWERVQICRHPQRPHSIDYIKNICDSFEEIHGDRAVRDDAAVIAGMGMIGGEKFMIVAQEKGSDTEDRLKRNFGMPHPEGYRKAIRAMRLAEKFNIPVLSLLDTPGAFCGLSAEERGQGWAIANNLWEMAQIQTPIICILIGEGCSGGALGMGVGDVIAILEHAYYSVISPEGCSSILWKDASKNDVAAEALKMHAESLLELGVVDDMIEEPLGGAHHDPQVVYKNVKNYTLAQWDRLKKLSGKELVDKRYAKFRVMGEYSEELT